MTSLSIRVAGKSSSGIPQDVFELRGYDVIDAQFVQCQTTGVTLDFDVEKDYVTLLTLSHGNTQSNFFITMYSITPYLKHHTSSIVVQ